MRRLCTSVLVMTLLVAGEAQADFYEGNQLDEHCKSPTGVCFGYVAGIADVLLQTRIRDWHACVPAEVTLVQAVDIVKQYLDRNPMKHRMPAAGLVAEALQQAFPCKQ
jgi:hypothetical protein